MKCPTGQTVNTAEFFAAGSATASVVVDETGNVGIGTTNPQVKLHVNGTFSASGSVIQTKYLVVTNSPSNIMSSLATDVSSGVSVSITPNFTSSKILVNFSAGRAIGRGASGSLIVSLYRNGTNITAGTLGWMTLHLSAGTVADAIASPIHATYIDVPTTISAVTYTIYYKAVTAGSSVGIALTGSSYSLIAQEIGA